eukprot:Tbor_TRINITY_DN5983_c1_g3::TRINITY_DN5983_c1_g3_i1::g.18651::m.18651
MGKGKSHKRKKRDIDTPHELRFITGGILNMIALRNNKQVTQVNAYTETILTDPTIVRHTSMDNITFLPNAVFKVTLDFSKLKVCMAETAVREATDWVLCSCLGSDVYYDKTSLLLVLQQCMVCIQSNVKQLEMPFGLEMRYEDEMWEVVRVFR